MNLAQLISDLNAPVSDQKALELLNLVRKGEATLEVRNVGTADRPSIEVAAVEHLDLEFEEVEDGMADREEHLLKVFDSWQEASAYLAGI